MKKILGVLLFILFLFANCAQHKKGDPPDLSAIIGSWKGRHISNVERPFSEINVFTLRPDSTLALSMIYELGPRSRVWTPDADVDLRDGTMHWKGHGAVLSRTRDSMQVTRTESWGTSSWVFVRDRSADSLMMELRAPTPGAYTYKSPENLSDGWQCTDLTARGIKGSKIVELIEEIRAGKHDDIHSFLLVNEGRLVVEEYFADNGRKHGPIITTLFRDKVHHLASTTKSITSTLVGIAIGRGFIKSVEDPIYHYLPSYAELFDEGKRRIRISDMLTMTAGFEWRQFGVSDNRNDGMQMWNTPDVIKYVLQKPLEAEPGKKFNYTNGVPTVTGAIIKNAVGTDVVRFAEQYLFRPLGISQYLWTSYPDSSIETDGGLALRSRDLAKIGQLFLNNGLWNGERVVSEQWVHESTKARLRFGRSNRWGYGYHWTQAESQIGGRLVRSYFVPGDGNQIVAVFPDLATVVVFTAGNYGKDPKPVYYELFEEFIIPAVTPGEW
jgi:CubicO group peptidase (beta-lactamase class C family)